MGFAVVFTRAQVGIEAPEVKVEVNLAKGMPAFQIIGMPETTVREAKDRVRTALINSGLEFPVARITVNLSPAELPKQGARFDLAIALGLLAAQGQLSTKLLDTFECYGELALDGRIRPIAGALPSLMAAQNAGRFAMIPPDNSAEASLLRERCAIPVTDLKAAVAHLEHQEVQGFVEPAELAIHTQYHGDIAEVQGQSLAKRALLIAAAAGHHVLFVGPPGTGKTMLARRLAGLMPPLCQDEALEVAAIHSLSGQRFDLAQWRQRPFRAPHHSCSAAALVGGGSSIPRPGEITLAHRGILFLDELTEMPRSVLDSLREPLESGHVQISRARQTAMYPARFQLVCALNPSPCGQFDGDLSSARSTPDQILNYLGRLSGPFLDRIDLQVEVPRQPDALRRVNLRKVNPEDRTDALAERVATIRDLQWARQGCLNRDIPVTALGELCTLKEEDHDFLVTAMEKLQLSHRAYHRTLRVARTIADLECAERIERPHLGEAMSYRALDTLLNRLREL